MERGCFVEAWTEASYNEGLQRERVLTTAWAFCFFFPPSSCWFFFFFGKLGWAG